MTLKYRLTLKEGFEVIAIGILEVPDRYFKRRFEDTLDSYDAPDEQDREQVEYEATQRIDEKILKMERQLNKKGTIRVHIESLPEQEGPKSKKGKSKKRK